MPRDSRMYDDRHWEGRNIPFEEQHAIAREQVANLIQTRCEEDKVPVLRHVKDSVGPMGGVSTEITLIVRNSGVNVPVVLSIYADKRIDEKVNDLIERQHEARELSDKIAHYLKDQPLEVEAGLE